MRYFVEEGDDKQEVKQVFCLYIQNSLTTVIGNNLKQ